MHEHVSPDLAKALAGLASSTVASAIGALMRHTHLAQAGHRRFWSLHLVFEVPTVIGMGVIGGGLARYLGLPEEASWAVCAVLAYYGPKGLDWGVAALGAKLGVKVETKAGG